MATDLELLLAWRDGDQDAGDALIERHFEALCRFFRSKLGPSLPELEDLIQRTLLDCAERVGQTNIQSFKAYLFAIARNRLFDHLRAQQRAPIQDLASSSIADLRTSPSQQLARAEARALVVRALQRLPLDFQITLELKYWEQLSDAEIAEALDVSANTVRSRLSRGRALLKEELERLASSLQTAETTLARFLGG